ncbi:hypothetical protein BDK51DRAFT_39860 [Blyttiomyces helicus]|uniref:Clathrin/coatomer adaptor adaptin-like N-terminal domain-containing protein n=1 Tax=Blyttiomyces helicus TaxID=388810 RepID=A0A4P9WCS8_9FUNG|nr:hypothetical protein BDK51DRAFT_39860 [Blyttiomyces helicus]|eukprot:RKO89028.1 hypothetical protein BDK51DRAFT_39860 [Blyttiomyces helicus]
MTKRGQIDADGAEQRTVHLKRGERRGEETETLSHVQMNCSRVQEFGVSALVTVYLPRCSVWRRKDWELSRALSVVLVNTGPPRPPSQLPTPPSHPCPAATRLASLKQLSELELTLNPPEYCTDSAKAACPKNTSLPNGGHLPHPYPARWCGSSLHVASLLLPEPPYACHGAAQPSLTARSLTVSPLSPILPRRTDDKEQPTVQELRSALEKGSPDQKIETLKKILIIMLNGDPLPQLLMPIIQFALRDKSKPLKKLLLVYWEICPKTNPDGKLKQEMILVW